MKFVIRLVALLLVGMSASGSSANADAFESILRDAALKNGLVPSAQLFIGRDENLAPQGQRFFESKSLSINGEMSCQTCHLDKFGSADGLPNAIGVFGEGEGPKRATSEGLIIPRNTLALWGRGAKGFDTFFWDGKVDFSGAKPISQFGSNPPSSDALVTVVHLPPLEIREMLADGELVSRYKHEDISRAESLHQEILKMLHRKEEKTMAALASNLGKAPLALSFNDVARSISAFIRSKFRLKDTRLHKFVFGNGELTKKEVRGGILFYGKGKCSNCHNGPYFSDLKFHAVPTPQIGFGKNGFGIDYGRYNVTFDPDDMYKFRTPPLINVVSTAPYGHAGSLLTIEDAIISHFDPLRLVNIGNATNVQRQELYKRIAAAKEVFLMIGSLDDDEVQQVTSFLKALSY